MIFQPFRFVPGEIVLRHIFEQSVVGIFQSTIEGRNLLANPAFAFMLGYSSPDELRDCITDVARQFYVDPERRGEINQLIARGGGHVEECESQVWRKDGSIIWISENTRVAINPDDGHPIYLGCIADITARKQSELALAENAVRLRREIARRRAAERALERSVSQALVVCAEDGEIEFCTERAAAILCAHYGLTPPPAALPAALQSVLQDTELPLAGVSIDTPRGSLLLKPAGGSAGEGTRAFSLEEPFRHRLVTCLALRGLTPRESEVLFWINNAKTNLEIAGLLGVAEKTVKKHLENAYQKLGVENRTAAVLRVNQWLDHHP